MDKTSGISISTKINVYVSFVNAVSNNLSNALQSFDGTLSGYIRADGGCNVQGGGTVYVLQ